MKNFENGDVLREAEKMVVDFYKQEKSIGLAVVMIMKILKNIFLKII